MGSLATPVKFNTHMRVTLSRVRDVLFRKTKTFINTDVPTHTHVKYTQTAPSAARNSSLAA
jgi:hypothetical protein